MKTSIILVGAGLGERFGQAKALVKLAGETLLHRNLKLFEKLPFEHEIIVVVSEDIIPQAKKIARDKSIKVIAGGNERIDSVRKGLEAATGSLVMIHNVANPWAQLQDFNRIHEALVKQDCACFVGQPMVDTIRKMNGDQSLTLDRNNVWRVQTPQGFRKESLLEVLSASKGKKITDEVYLFEKSKIPVVSFETSIMNMKITYPQDLEFFEMLLRKKVLTGIGEDSHCFDDSGTMTLGGVKIKDLPKLKANSDGDLILHALFNAISSALGEGSISLTADPMVEQGIIDSSIYLDTLLDIANKRRYRLNNISISLECARPKIDPLTDDIKASLSKMLDVEIRNIGITATSGEKLTSFGKGEGIRCSCVVSLVKYE